MARDHIRAMVTGEYLIILPTTNTIPCLFLFGVSLSPLEEFLVKTEGFVLFTVVF
jgi:hypothetical protein